MFPTQKDVDALKAALEFEKDIYNVRIPTGGFLAVILKSGNINSEQAVRVQNLLGQIVENCPNFLV